MDELREHAKYQRKLAKRGIGEWFPLEGKIEGVSADDAFTDHAQRAARNHQIILLANRNGVMGPFTSRRWDPAAKTWDWWINDTYYDGDEPPRWYLVLPQIPVLEGLVAAVLGKAG